VAQTAQSIPVNILSMETCCSTPWWDWSDTTTFADCATMMIMVVMMVMMIFFWKWHF